MLKLALESLIITVAVCVVVAIAVAIMIAALHFGGLYGYFGLVFLVLWGLTFFGKVVAAACIENSEDEDD